MSFSQLGLQPELARALSDAKYIQPTPIQSKAIPVILGGKDVVGTAQTGTGKTAAFLLPLLQRLASPSHNTRGLILTPTRELATQVEQAIRKYGRFLKLRSTAIYGGVSQRMQEQALRKGVDVVVATPGRLLDLIEQKCVDITAVEILVLDEADRMLDMGFLPDIQRIVHHLPKQRQTLLFSATMPQEIRDLARSLQKNSVLVEVAKQLEAAVGVEQKQLPVPTHLKAALLLHLASKKSMKRVLVFTRTKDGADRLHSFLESHGIPTARIHSGLTQRQRQEALDGFRQSRTQFLVATDIAARGIDVQSISHVINFDVPHNIDDYIHRIGRTGRAEMSGYAFTLVCPEDEFLVRAIENSGGKKIERLRLDDFDYATPPKSTAGRSKTLLSPGGRIRKPSSQKATGGMRKVFDRAVHVSRAWAGHAGENKPATFAGKEWRKRPGNRSRDVGISASSAGERRVGLPSIEEQLELRRLQEKLFGTTSRHSFHQRNSRKGNLRSRY